MLCCSSARPVTPGLRPRSSCVDAGCGLGQVGCAAASTSREPTLHVKPHSHAHIEQRTGLY